MFSATNFNIFAFNKYEDKFLFQHFSVQHEHYNHKLVRKERFYSRIYTNRRVFYRL